MDLDEVITHAMCCGPASTFRERIKKELAEFLNLKKEAFVADSEHDSGVKVFMEQDLDGFIKEVLK